ncbi:MAG: GAF domain-containing protein, partial [Anaerolineales bacterium]|nr:GAF domain-containing protein [Anaerolineales bacterium]
MTILLLFVSLVIVGVLLFEVSAGRRLEADVRAAHLALADAVAQETDTVMANALDTVRNLAAYPAVVAADPTGMAPLFTAVMHGRSDINLTYRLDSDGIMRFHYPVEPESTVGIDFSFRDYFQQARASREPLVSRGRISPTTDEPVATAVMPIWDGSRFLGVVATNLRLQSLSDTLASITRDYHEDDTFQLFIVDDAGQIIAHSDPAQLLQDAHMAAPAVTTAVLARQSGSLVARDQTGIDRLYSYVPIREVGWGVVVSQPTAAAFATLTAFRRGVLLAILTFLVASALLWLILARRVIRPIERLANFSQNVGLSSGPDKPPEHALMSALIARTDQMGVLTRSLQRMQQAIQARLNELSTLLDTSAAVVSSLDSETVLNRILEQVERLLDARMSAIIALDEEHRIFRVYASRQLPQWYVDQVTIDPQEPTSVTMRAIRSGQPVQISDTEDNPSFRYHRARARQAGF